MCGHWLTFRALPLPPAPMDLKSDFPFWTLRNRLVNTYPPLTSDLKCYALVIGGTISGALVAARLVKKDQEKTASPISLTLHAKESVGERARVKGTIGLKQKENSWLRNRRIVLPVQTPKEKTKFIK